MTQSKRGKCSQPCAHRGGKESHSPSWLPFQTLPGLSPFQKGLIRNSHSKSDSEGETVVRPMIYCSFHPVPLAMAAFWEHLKTKEKVNHLIGFNSAKTPWKLQYVSWRGIGRGKLVTPTSCDIPVPSKKHLRCWFTVCSFSWFFTGFCASGYVGDTTNDKSGR